MTLNSKYYKNWRKALISKNCTIKKAIQNLNFTALQICFVVKKNKILIGTITDGDIRRALLDKCSIDDKITKYINYKPKKIFEKFTNKEFKSLLNKYKMTTIPVVNKNNQIIDAVSWRDLKDQNNYINIPLIFVVGGKGTRLAPLTKNVPKPMIKIKGVPILQRLVLKAKSEGFNNFYFITNYLHNKIATHFGDGERFGVNIKYVQEKKPLGTAGGLALDHFNYKTVIVSNGDVLTEASYKSLLLYHVNSKNHLTVGIKNIRTANPYGVIKISKGTRIRKLIEKPVEDNFVSVGVYVFESKLFSFIKKNRYLDMSSFINLLVKKNKKVGVCPIHENWLDIGSHSDLNKVT